MTLSPDQINILSEYMNDPNVLYPQRVRYFFYTCKEQISGRHTVNTVKLLDRVLTVALLQNQEWHESFKGVLAQAVELNLLHNSDYEISCLI